MQGVSYSCPGYPVICGGFPLINITKQMSLKCCHWKLPFTVNLFLFCNRKIQSNPIKENSSLIELFQKDFSCICRLAWCIRLPCLCKLFIQNLGGDDELPQSCFYRSTRPVTWRLAQKFAATPPGPPGCQSMSVRMGQGKSRGLGTPAERCCMIPSSSSWARRSWRPGSVPALDLARLTVSTGYELEQRWWGIVHLQFCDCSQVLRYRSENLNEMCLLALFGSLGRYSWFICK